LVKNKIPKSTKSPEEQKADAEKRAKFIEEVKAMIPKYSDLQKKKK
jgi:hypothetical protein